MSKVVKGKRKVRRECEDYQSLTEYERNVAQRDEFDKDNQDCGIANAHAE
jgi:hypothetical protein